MRVLDALGIRFGPAHTELMLTKEGPLLIEIGARLDGSDAPIIGERAYGINQIHLTADCYLDQTS
jgi:biotin carboxylase